jgi:hypothetical protein
MAETMLEITQNEHKNEKLLLAPAISTSISLNKSTMCSTEKIQQRRTSGGNGENRSQCNWYQEKTEKRERTEAWISLRFHSMPDFERKVIQSD